MPSMFEMVKEFQRDVIKYPLPAAPVLASTTVRDLIYGQLVHVEEELHEINLALDSHSLVGMADGITDAVYVLLGIAARIGLPIDEIFEVVHRANMQKVAGITKRNIDYDAVKPAEWVSPESKIADIIIEKMMPAR